MKIPNLSSTSFLTENSVTTKSLGLLKEAHRTLPEELALDLKRLKI
jgi:hypothetical protein